MNKLSNLKNLEPCIFENEAKIVAKQDYKLRKVCFKENAGKIVFSERNGIFITKATIYSEYFRKNVTKKIIQHVKQQDEFLDSISINTFIFNKFTRGNKKMFDLNKRLVVEYITDKNISEEKQVTYVETCNGYYTRKKINNITNCGTVDNVPFEEQNICNTYIINKQVECDRR